MKLKRSEIKKITSMQLEEWVHKNADPGVLPSIPVILINQLTGDKPGITCNFSKHLSIHDTASILRATLQQVEAKITEVEAN